MKTVAFSILRLLIPVLLIGAGFSVAFGADTGWLNPSGHQPGPLFDGFETNPTGAYASGGVVAQDTRTGGLGSRGDEHRYFGFGPGIVFDLSSIPDTASIIGIEIKLTAQKIASNAAAMSVMVSKNGPTTWTGTALSTPDLATTLTTYVLGGPTQLWGLGATLGAALKGASNTFVVKIQNTSSNNSGKTWQLDWLQVKIYYGYVPDLTIAKTHTGNFTQGQTGATYGISVSNIGFGPTTGTVTVVDALPTGLSATAMSGTGWACNPVTRTCTRSDALAIGNSYPQITLTVNVAGDAPPSVTNTATVSGGGESNTANNTAVDPTTVIQLVPGLNVTKRVLDENGGNLKVLDTLLYTVVIQNPTGGYLAGARFTDVLPANTNLIPGSVSAPAGSTIVTDTPTLDITGINVPARSLQTITFRVFVTGGTAVSNQGAIAYDADGNGTNEASQLTDGDTVTPGDQPTVIAISAGPAPNFGLTAKSVDLFAEAVVDGAVSPGDTLRYTITIPNTGDQDAAGVAFTDPVPVNTAYVSGSVTATSGAASYNAGLSRIDWTGDLNAGASVAIAFRVTVNAGVAAGTVIANQGTVTHNASAVVTDGDVTAPGRQTTNVTVAAMPHGVAVKSVLDENGGNLAPGDSLRYTIVIYNQCGMAVNGIEYVDEIPNNTSYIAGSASAPAGSTIVTQTPSLRITGINVPVYSQQTVTFRVQVDDPLPVGVTRISNQGTVFYDSDGIGGNDAIRLTDGDTTRPGNQPTLIPVSVGPIFDQMTKSVALANDADGNGVITPGDTLRYNVKILNSGSEEATGVTFTDPVSVYTTYVNGSVIATIDAVPIAGASYNGALNQIEWTGDVGAGTMVVVEFDVTVNSSGVIIGTVISNQGTLLYDSSSMLTDGDRTAPGRQTTDVTVGGAAHGFGTKTAVDVNGGILEPGDILEYTIEIHNTSGFWGNGLEFTDVIPNNTTYVPGSVHIDYLEGSPVIETETPALYITGIVMPPHSQITITFRVQLDDPLPAGVTQISNQAFVFYDRNTDGINDTLQGTDGDPASPGNQPTVTLISGGAISGTVFDDNGDGVGGIAGNGLQDGDEPGISSVTVQLYNEYFALLYGTLTNGSGYYGFMGLSSGTYLVYATNPLNYTATTPNIVTVILPSGGSADVDFGFKEFAGAGGDMTITKTCTPLYPGGSPQQLVCLIRLTNNGPETADDVVLTDDLSSLIASGLSNVSYTVDGGAPVNLVGNLLSLSWPAIVFGDSHVIRVFADVSETFTPLVNVAAVFSANDGAPGNNISNCINWISGHARRAIDFTAGGNAYVTVANADDFDLTAAGALEAWIYPKAFTADAGIVVKGTSSICYGFGLGGGTGGVFSGGTARNIVFVLYDDAGNKYLLPALDHTLVANKWHHVACVWNGSLPGDIDMVIYINGVEEAATTFSIPDVRTNSENLIIGLQPVAPAEFSGVIDEVRVWNAPRNIDAHIREYMCKTVPADNPAEILNLVCYLRFDANSGPVCSDHSGRGNIGIITNAQRVCSTAPVGDVSDFDYDDSDFNVNFSNPNLAGESLEVDGNGGTWSEADKSGLQVYWVEDAPDDGGRGPLGWKLFRDRGYFGVFVTGGIDPTYEITHTYDPAGIGQQDNLKLAFRHGNCEPWKDLDATIGSGVLTKQDQSGTEYILGIAVDPRNAILFDADTDDYVLVEDNVDGGDLDLILYGAIEAWINITGYQDNAGIICKGDGSNASYSLYMGSGAANDQVYFTVDDLIGSTSSITSTITLNLDTWYHIAGTWDANNATNNMKLFINGVQDGAANAISAGASNADVYIGYSPTTAGNFYGLIDEVRIWKISAAANMRTQTLIRDTMCRKLAGNEADLSGYWRFDEETASNTCPDYSGNGNDGTMTGFADIRASRVCSPAPIGDDSDWVYYTDVGAGNVNVQLTHLDGDYLYAGEFGGTWTNTFSGIHVYRLDEPPVYPPDLWNTAPYTYVTPNGLSPPAGPPAWSSVDYYRYWGVFVTDWDTTNAPDYDVIYNYLGNPMVPLTADGTPGNPELGLAKRDEYCGVWVDSGADWDTVNGQLELLGANGDEQSQYGTPPTNPEYILGGINQPLAITLASFTAAVFDGCVEIEWETATEIGTVGFYLWRGTQRDGAYEMIPNSYTRSNSLMETMGARYAYTDCGVDFTISDRYYYKLEEVEAGPTESRRFYGPIGPVSETVGASQDISNLSPAPYAKSDGSFGCFIGALMD